MTNRAERRRREKLSRNATADEIFPKGQHGPTNLPGAGNSMTNILGALRELMPGWEFTLFAFEPPAEGKKHNRLPRFNYGSTVDRPDMVAVLEAFLLKQKDPAEYARLAQLDQFHNDQTTQGKA